MYSQALCSYCEAARKLLEDKGVNVTEIDVTMNTALRAEMIDRSGRRTTPQIFINDRHLGGYDDILELDRNNELDALLNVV